MVADHGPLLEPGALGAGEGHAAAVAVAQVVDLNTYEYKCVSYLFDIPKEEIEVPI